MAVRVVLVKPVVTEAGNLGIHFLPNHLKPMLKAMAATCLCKLHHVHGFSWLLEQRACTGYGTKDGCNGEKFDDHPN